MKKTARLSILFVCVLTLLFVFFSISASAEEARVAVSSTEFQTHQGETFTTTIYIPDNANIVDFDITLNYDKDLVTLNSVQENDGIKGEAVFNSSTEGQISVNYTRTNRNVTKYLPLLDVTFTVDENVGVGTYDLFSIDASSRYIAHTLNDAGTLDEVDFACDFAKLVIYEMGDVDLNRDVNIADATYIRRHLAEFDGAILSDYKLTVADTFYDGIVDIADAACLQRHLAKYDVLYGDRVNVTFCDMNGEKYASKSVYYNGTLYKIPAVPAVDGYSNGVWSLSRTEYVAPSFEDLTKDLTVYAYYNDHSDPAMDYYKKILTNMYYSGDLPTNMNSSLDLQDKVYYQEGNYASLVWSSDSNYILNSTTGAFTKPTYPHDLTLTAHIISYTSGNKIDAEEDIAFSYSVPGIYQTPTKASVEDFLKFYFTDDTDGKYRINYDVKLISKVNNTVIPVEGSMYDNFEIRLDWYQNVNGTLQPINQVKRTTTSQTNDYVAVATFNGKPLEGDGKIYIDDVEVTAIDQMEIKNYIINQISNTGTLATDGKELWNNDHVYGTTVTWETGADDIAYVANNVIRLKDDAVTGSTLPLNARVSYGVDGGSEEFILSYNLTVSCDNTIIKAPENMDPELYRAIKTELEETLGYRGDLTSAALANVKFVNLDLSDYPEITSFRGLSYCKNLRTLNMSGIHITDGTMNQIATLSYLEAFIARGCGLDNLTDGGTATLRNAVNLKMIDLTDNNFTSLDSVFAPGMRYGKLREVYLSKNKLTDINALSRAPMMTYLSLSENGLTTEGSASIANYPYLLYLSLANNNIDSVEHLKGLKYLKELRLQNNNISNVNDLRRLVNLEILYLGHNKIRDIGNLNTLTQLQILYVNDNKIFDISNLRDLTKLEAINVSNNSISSLSVLSNYKSTLTEIYAENNSLTDFSFINGASKLHILMLAGNEVELAQENMTTWLAGLGEMEILTLSDIRLNDLSFLDSMTKLVRLDVANCGLNAFSGEESNIQKIADRYEKLRILNISDNDFSDGENEILKLRNVTLLTVLYADNICNHLDAYTLTYSMTELKWISLENCGITTMNWLYKFNGLEYVDLAGNSISDVNLESHISNASIKTIKELYLDTNVSCSFANAFRIMDFNVEKLSLQGVSVEKMERMPYLDSIKYLNLDNTGLLNLTGDDLELADLYSVSRYTTLDTIDVSNLDLDIAPIENLASVDTVYAVGATDSKLFYEDNLHTLQRLYNKGLTCYLYDKKTVYEPVAAREGTDILNLIKDISCDITVAADNKISDNNPFLIDEINDFDITWTVSNSDNYEVINNHLSVKDYSGIEDEELTVTATITVYPDQAPVSRDFIINSHILRADVNYYEIDATGYSEQLTRDSAFNYALTLKTADTIGFSEPVKPVEDNINYSYSAVLENGNPLYAYQNALIVNSDHSFEITSNAPLNSVITISIDITHNTKSGSVIKDIETITAPITVASRTFTATFMMDGGTIIDSNGLAINSRQYVEDTLIFENLTYSRPGYVFKGWYTDARFQNLFSLDGTDAAMPSYDIELFARWEALSYNVLFNANGGVTPVESIVALSDVALGDLPTPTREYYTFDGWFTDASGGTQVTSETRFARTDDLPLYAHWTLNSFIVHFDAAGGSTDTSELRAYCGKALGELPIPSRDYYTFDGWYTSTTGGTKVTESNTYYSANDMTVYAHWIINATSDWVKASEMPADAELVSRKWIYTEKTLKDSKNPSESGYTLISSEWKKSGSDSRYYASFPSGFDHGNWYYKNWNSGPYSKSESQTNKREVNNTRAGYIYWHWMYDCGGANAYYRAIWNQYGYGPDNGYLYKYFGAFDSTSGYSTQGNSYNNGCGLTTYYGTGRNSYDESQGSYYWFRFDYYKSTYTDYYKLFHYYREDSKESTSQPTASSTIYNIEEWVQYRPKSVSYTDKKTVDYNGHTYRLIEASSPISWDIAKAYCEQSGGYLATITSAEEQNNVVSQFGETYAWLGGYRVSDTEWAWVTGEPFSYANWREDEPNNYNGVENCIGFYPDNGWNDYANSTSAVSNFILEIEG